MPDVRRIVVALTGASGAIYGVRVLQVLQKRRDIETHLILTSGGRTTLLQESGMAPGQVCELADIVHRERDLAASIASGSFHTDGMIVAPCSIKTLSAIATSHSENLVSRAADVMLKERRRLVLMVRETPLHIGHLRLMAQAAENGAIIFPPVPAFYAHPASIDELVDHTVARALEQLGVDTGTFPRWTGPRTGLERLGELQLPSR